MLIGGSGEDRLDSRDDVGGARWITVSPKGSSTRVVLKKAEKEHERAMVGNSDGALILTLGTDDIQAAYERLKERGVRFLGPGGNSRRFPRRRSW